MQELEQTQNHWSIHAELLVEVVVVGLQGNKEGTQGERLGEGLVTRARQGAPPEEALEMLRPSMTNSGYSSGVVIFCTGIQI